MKIDNSCIVLTGGGSGIGKAMLEQLQAFKGLQIVVADLRTENLPTGPGLHSFACDLSRQEQVDALFDFALEKMGRIDIFIANAGFAYYEKTEQEDWQRIENIYRTNTFSPIYATHKMARLNRGREHAVLVTASFMGLFSLPGYSLYSSTKAALDSWASAYWLERDGVEKCGHLSLLYPVATRTSFFGKANNGVPVPWPTQDPEDVARAAIRGIQENRQRIFPSRLSRVTLLLDRVFPPTMPIYQAVERFKFQRWVSRQRDKSRE